MNGYEIRVLKPNGDTALISAPIQRADSAAIRVRQEACWRLQVRGLERAGCIYRSVKKLPADRPPEPVTRRSRCGAGNRALYVRKGAYLDTPTLYGSSHGTFADW